MGTCIYSPLMGTLDNQNALADLRHWKLERDDTQTLYPHRIYRDTKKNVYHSVTHILSQTAPQEKKDALERWLQRPNSYTERDIACKRGELAHSHAEYLLKTGAKLSRNAGNNRGVWKTGSDGLERCPSKVTKWALEKAAENAPKVGFSASGYARGLRSFILERVTAIHASEFSVYNEKHGYAGTADALIDIDGDGPFIADWKTAKDARSESIIDQFCCQLGAYSLALKSLIGLRPKKGAVIIARRSGAPQIKILSELELRAAEVWFLERNEQYQQSLQKSVSSF